MLNQLTKYGASLIALYLIVGNASGFGNLITQGAAGVSQVTKTLQARG